MEKTTTTAFGRMIMEPVVKEKEKRFKIPEFLPKRLIFKHAFPFLLAFLYGRITVFQIFSPVGIAAVSAALTDGKKYYITGILVLLGLLSSRWQGALLKYIICLLIASAIHFVFQRKIAFWDTYKKAFAGGACIFLSGSLLAAFEDFSKYLFVTAGMEAIMVFCISVIMDKGMEVIKNDVQRKILSTEEILSFSILIAAGIGGMRNIVIYGVPLNIICAIFVILTAGYGGGAAIGASAGVLMGFTLLITGEGTVSTFCVLSISGILCGALRSMGRVVTVASCFAGILIAAFYMEEAFLSRDTIMALLIGAALFFVFQKKVTSALHFFGGFDQIFKEEKYFESVRGIIRDKLNNVSHSFHKLGRTFSEQTAKEDAMGRKAIAKMIDDVGGKTCSGCGLCAYCWESEFYNTYHALITVFTTCKKRGQIRKEDLPTALRESCVRVEYLTESINRVYELYKTNALWQKRLEESRYLVKEQLDAVADIIDEVAESINFKVIFYDAYEKEIMTALDREGVAVRRVMVLTREECRYEAVIEYTMGYLETDCTDLIIRTATHILGKKMMKEHAGNYRTVDGTDIVKLVEEPAFRFCTGISAAVREDSEISGDSYTFTELKDGSFMMALSDGMGSGKGANLESRTTIELLEQFAECGFRKEIALKIMNSVLLLKSTEEQFSTLDLCCVNAYSGRAEFIKIGAAAAFVVRGDTVKGIRSYSLPLGILNGIDMDKSEYTLRHGDVVIMMTDGVTDIIEEGQKGEEWLKEIFKNFWSSNPQDIADYVMHKVKKSIDYAVKDDMTIAAMRVWERI